MIKGSSTKIKKPVRKENPKKKCEKCETIYPITNFYTSDNPKHSHEVLELCKNCVRPEDQNDLTEVQQILFMLDRPYNPDKWKIAVERANKRWGEGNKGAFGIYLSNLKIPNTPANNLTSKDSKNMIDNNLIIAPKLDTQKQPEDTISQEDCIRLLGYAPFDGYLISDQPILYGQLINYLDEDTLEDQHKISVIIQILNNNIQVKKIDSLINEFSSDEKKWKAHAADIKNLQTQKNQLVSNNDKLTKENSIAVKHRGDKKAGQSTLGGMMKNLRDLGGFEDVEENYYDMKKAYGMQITAEISNKAILSQLNFDEKDIQDIFKSQRELITELQSKVDELEEKLRIAKISLKSGDLN